MKKHNVLFGENVCLRALEPHDLEHLYEWENDTDVWRISNTIVPYSKYILKKYLEKAHLDLFTTKQLRLMVDALNIDGGQKTIGSIDLFDYDPFHQRAGVGILIANKKFRNKGYASEAINVLIDYSFSLLGMHQLYCNIATDNKHSLQLFKKAGFEIIGEKKQWLRIYEGWIGEYMLQLINPKHT